MNKNIRLIQEYIDNDASFVIDVAKNKLPASQKQFLKLYLVNIFGKNYRFAKVYKKCDLEWLMEIKDVMKIDAFSFDDLSRYSIKNYIKNRLPFVSNSIFFLPFLTLMIDCKTVHKESLQNLKFDPADQLISLYILLNSLDEFSVQDLVVGTGLSEITISRFIKKIESDAVISFETTGVRNLKRIYHIFDLSVFYEKISKRFFNPVFSTIYVDSKTNTKEVLETSITTENLIDETPQKPRNIYAAYKKNKSLGNLELMNVDEAIDKGKPQIVLFKYDITKLSNGNDLDPLTMKLAFPNLDRQTKDILETWLSSFSWYKPQ